MGASAILPELFKMKKSSEDVDDDAGIARCSISKYKPGSIINKGVNAFKMGCILEGFALLKTGHVVADRLEPGDMYGGVTMIEQAREEHYPSSPLAEISNRHSRLLYGCQAARGALLHQDASRDHILAEQRLTKPLKCRLLLSARPTASLWQDRRAARLPW